MTAVSTLIRKVERDPRYPRYVQALLDGGISLETAIRAAAVRIESEDFQDRKWAAYQARYEVRLKAAGGRGHAGLKPDRGAHRVPSADRGHKAHVWGMGQ